MKRIVLSAVLTSSLFAGESENIIQSSAYGKRVIEENNVTVYDREKKNYYSDEVLFNYIMTYKNMNERPYNSDKKHSLISLVKEKEIKTKDSKSKSVESLSISGYCNVSEDINIGKQPSSAFMECNTNIGIIKVFGNIIPKNELASAFYDPQYIEYKNTRFKVLPNSITTNEARTSYNIATFVNDRKLAEIGYSSTIASTDIIQTTTHEYLKALEKSKTEKGVEYSKIGDDIIPVQTEKTQAPEAKDYIVKAGIDIVAGVIKTTAEVFKKDLPYLYQIKKNSKVFIDLKINKKGEKIK